MDDWQTTFSFLADAGDVRGRSVLGSPIDVPGIQVPTPPVRTHPVPAASSGADLISRNHTKGRR